MPSVACQGCGKRFHAKPNWIKIGWGKYCSRICVFESQRRGQNVFCFICKKEVYKSPKELIRSKSGNFFCSKTCQTVWRNKIVFIGKNHANWKFGENAYRRILTSNGEKPICRLCKSDDKRILAVHYKDKNRRNNRIENLVWLCHNCHYLVHHFEESRVKLSKLEESMVVVAQK